MAKYVTREIKANDDEAWWEEYPVVHVPNVDDATLTPTGLVDKRGVPFYRLPNPIGFGRKIEW